MAVRHVGWGSRLFHYSLCPSYTCNLGDVERGPYRGDWVHSFKAGESRHLLSQLGVGSLQTAVRRNAPDLSLRIDEVGLSEIATGGAS